MALELKNPHSVLAALQSRPIDVTEIRLSAGSAQGNWGEVADEARKHRIPVIIKKSAPQKMKRKQSEEQGRRTAGSVGMVKPRTPSSLGELFANAEGETELNGLWLAMDCIQDPHNIGAIFRTAAFFGVRGIVLTKDRSAPLNATVYDVASGGMEAIPFAVETNLSRAMTDAKKLGVWIMGTSEHAEDDVSAFHQDRPWMVVIGNEEKGLRRLTLEQCDVVCRLTPTGIVDSLNASVAAGIMIARFSPFGPGVK
ncbi:23S rRNA (guanosine(2251)-2'-O)-methyltransferase RlmB [uncultured Gimesia sp.]|uniref:23S rRNA (guanosine(2251)-2'-O)-methyltransferase RlmB n=1 Tax=uncultured Gimesia sp. TaxID=1678688 RepID=UPI0030DDD4A7